MKYYRDTASPEEAQRSISKLLCQISALFPRPPTVQLHQSSFATTTSSFSLDWLSVVLDIVKRQCRAQVAPLSMSPASVMGHALAILPTNSNGMSVTDHESSRQIPPNLPSLSLLLRGIYLPSCRIPRPFPLRERAPFIYTFSLHSHLGSKPLTPYESERRPCHSFVFVFAHSSVSN